MPWTACVAAAAPPPGCTWFPRQAVPSLVGPTGTFPREVEEVAARCRIEEVRAEWRAQIDRVLEAGFSISHLDGHMFCYEPEEANRADLLALVREFAHELQVPYRYRRSQEPYAPRGSIQIWEDYDETPRRLAFYEELLANPPPELTEVIIHPAAPDADFSERLRKAERRYADYQFFSGAAFRRLAAGVPIVGWRDIELSAVKQAV